MNENIKTTEIEADRYARWSYERLRLAQPQIESQGLFKSGDRFKIVVPNFLQLKADDGRTLQDWFRGNKALTSPVELVDSRSNEDIPVVPRTAMEIVAGVGEPRTLTDVSIELNLRLGSKFPRFVISDFPPYLGIVTVEKSLSKEEEKILISSLDDLQLPLRWEIKVGPIPAPIHKEAQGDISLVTSRDSRLSGFSSGLRGLIEKDDDLWVSEGRKILSGDKIESSNLADFYRSIKRPDSSLVNASVFCPDDIRNHITLFEATNIMLPIAGREQEALGGLGITESEFIELIAMGKVRVLLPLSVHRYSARLLDRIAEVKPDSLLMPRTLATAVADGTRKQFPYLFPPGTIEERAEYLKALLALKAQMPVGLFQSPIDALIEFHKKNWSSLEYVFNSRGSMAIQSHGPGAYISELFKSWSGKDQFIEFGHADMGINLSSALRATYFPTEGSGWSDQGHSAILAHVYHGGIGTLIGDFQKRMDVVLDGVLSIRKEVPVTELAKAIGQGDVARLKRHVFEMAHRADVTLEELRLAVEKINTEVKLIESNSERLSRWDMVGVFSGLAGAVVTQDPVQTVFVGAIVKRLLMELPDVRSKHPMVSATLDSIEGIWHKTTPDRILFARVRQRIEAKK